MENKLQQIDSLLGAGRVDDARKLFLVLVRAKLPRRIRADAAVLARRLSLPLVAIRLLNAIVRPPARKPPRPGARERAEYAAALIAIGARAEGGALLDGVDPAEAPEALLYRAYGHFAEWRYGAAIPCLEAYLRSPGVSEYQTIVARVNLAASLVYESREADALALLAELRETTRARGYFRLLANTYELSAQAEITCGRWDGAEAHLAAAEALFGSAGTLDAFFVEKWRAVARASRAAEDGLPALERVRAEAVRRGHGETVRDCDFFRARARRDEALAMRVFFGTPFPAYRARMLRLLPFPLEIPVRYELALGPDRSAAPLVDLADPERAPVAGKLRALLAALAADFYRACRIASLFAAVYPEEHFHPFHSPVRVHQCLRRLRRQLRAERIPLAVVESGAAYRIEGSPSIRLRVPRSPLIVDPHAEKLAVLKTFFAGREFTTRAAAAALRASPTTVQRLLRWGREKALVTAEGAGPSCTYRLAA